MQLQTILALIALALAYTFDFVNGFHDTANAVATVIYTKALKPRIAIVMSGVLNFLGCLIVGTAVAQVITQVIPRQHITLAVILAVLAAGLAWNIYTWYFGIPVSSSHCLIGALFGAGVAAEGLSGIHWQLLWEVLAALALSPLLGLAGGWLIASIVSPLVKRRFPGSDTSRRNQPQLMRWLQILSSAAVSFTHGSNDGQKTMGIITIILATQFAPGGFTFDTIPLWVIITAAAAIGLGTMIGGWRIIRTVGTKISRDHLMYTQGFSAEFSTAAIILSSSLAGWPVSTTHTLTSAVAGATVSVRGYYRLNTQMLKLIFSAWLLTLPVAAALGAAAYYLLSALGIP